MSGAKRVLVTGGGKGVGAAIVRALSAAHYDVDFTYRTSAQQALELADQLTGSGVIVRALPVDLSDRDAVAAFCGGLEETTYYGFVHNAGQPYDALAAMMAQDKAEIAMQVNFWSMTRIIKAVVRPMLRARTGRIIGIGSVAALEGNQGNAAYAASKGAMLSYLRTLAVESAKRGVTVNYVAPGFIDTDMLAPYAAYREQMEKQIPAGRFARPADIAALVKFLMSGDAGYITGAVLPVDGGLTATIAFQR